MLTEKRFEYVSELHETKIKFMPDDFPTNFKWILLLIITEPWGLNHSSDWPQAWRTEFGSRQTDFGTDRASYEMGSRSSFPQVKDAVA
jgi:hypothetical protein